MPYTVSDLRALEIEARLAPLFARSNYIHDQLRQANRRAEQYVMTGIAAVSVVDDTGADVAPADFSADDVVIPATQRAFANMNIDALDSDLNLEGVWDEEVAEQTAQQVRNRVDERIGASLMAATGTPINDGSSALTRQELRLAKARLSSLDGAGRMAVFAHPFGCAAMDTLAEFQPNFQQAEMGNLGIPMVGSIYGMPVFETNSAPNPNTHRFASTGWSVSTGTLTVTLAETDANRHGFVVGQRVTFDTVTAGGDMSAATAITGVSGGTITIASSGLSDGSATEAGTLTLADATIMVVDLSHAAARIVRRPTVRFAADPNSSNTSLQVWAHFGARARPGRVQTLYVDADDIQS